MGGGGRELQTLSVAQGLHVTSLPTASLLHVTLGCWNERRRRTVPNKSAASAALEARLETANPSDADLRKNNTRGGGGTDSGAQEHQVEHISLSVLEGSFLQEKIHQVFPQRSRRRKNGRGERQVLVGEGRPSAYFIPAVPSILLD